MSEAHALAFLRRVRENESLRRRIADCPAPVFDDLARIAAELGLTFDEADLACAYKHEWMLRSIYFSRRTA